MASELNNKIQIDLLVEVNEKSARLGGNTPVEINLDDPDRKFNFEYLDKYVCPTSRKRIFAGKKHPPLTQEEINKRRDEPRKSLDELRKECEANSKIPKPMPCGLTPFGHEFLGSLREKLRNKSLRESEVRYGIRGFYISLAAIVISGIVAGWTIYKDIRPLPEIQNQPASREAEHESQCVENSDRNEDSCNDPVNSAM